MVRAAAEALTLAEAAWAEMVAEALALAEAPASAWRHVRRHCRSFDGGR
jgi:hypothetical protein